MAMLPTGNPKIVSVGHSSGAFSVELETDAASNHTQIKRSALLRTARRLMEAHTLIPSAVWAGGRLQ